MPTRAVATEDRAEHRTDRRIEVRIIVRLRHCGVRLRPQFFQVPDLWKVEYSRAVPVKHSRIEIGALFEMATRNGFTRMIRDRCGGSGARCRAPVKRSGPLNA